MIPDTVNSSHSFSENANPSTTGDEMRYSSSENALPLSPAPPSDPASFPSPSPSFRATSSSLSPAPPSASSLAIFTRRISPFLSFTRRVTYRGSSLSPSDSSSPSLPEKHSHVLSSDSDSDSSPVSWSLGLTIDTW